MSKILAVSTLTPFINASVNRDQTGEAKTCVIGNVVRGRIASQSLKYAWRNSEAFIQLDKLAGSKHFRSRLAFDVLVAEELKKENLANAHKIPEYTALALQKITGGSKDTSETSDTDRTSDTDGTSDTDETTLTTEEISVAATKKSAKSTKQTKAKQTKAKKDVAIDLSSKQLISISMAEIEVIRAAIRTALETGDVSAIQELDLKALSYELPASISLSGKFNTSTELYTVDSSFDVSHGFSIHQYVSDSDSYIASDDLAPKGSGAGYMDNTNITSNIYYLFLAIDLDHYCRNRFEQNLAAVCQDATKKALVINEIAPLLEIIFQVVPKGKHSSTAPNTKANFGFLELSSSPQSAASAFWVPVKNDSSIWSNAYNRLIDFFSDTDAIYNTKQDVSRGYFGLYMDQDQKQAFEQDLGCSRVNMNSLKTWLESAIDKINTEI